MTHATDFTRSDCKLGKQRLSYNRLTSEYRCGDCGSYLGERWSEACPEYPENWYIDCMTCGSFNFIHERELAKQQSEAIEVLDGLPSEMQELLQPERAQIPERPPGIFSLSYPEIEL